MNKELFGKYVNLLEIELRKEKLEIIDESLFGKKG